MKLIVAAHFLYAGLMFAVALPDATTKTLGADVLAGHSGTLVLPAKPCQSGEEWDERIRKCVAKPRGSHE